MFILASMRSRLAGLPIRFALIHNLGHVAPVFFHVEVSFPTLGQFGQRLAGMHRPLMFVNRFLGVHVDSYVVVTVTVPTLVTDTK